MGQRYADEGNYIIYYFQYQDAVGCFAMSCGGESFSPYGAYDYAWDTIKPMKGKYTINYFQYQEVVGCVCMLKDWFSSCCVFCADNYNYFQFKLKGKGRSSGCAVLGVQRHPCRDAEAGSHGPASQLQYMTRCSLSLLCRSCEFHRCRRGEVSRAPTVALVGLCLG